MTNFRFGVAQTCCGCPVSQAEKPERVQVTVAGMTAGTPCTSYNGTFILQPLQHGGIFSLLYNPLEWDVCAWSVSLPGWDYTVFDPGPFPVFYSAVLAQVRLLRLLIARKIADHTKWSLGLVWQDQGTVDLAWLQHDFSYSESDKLDLMTIADHWSTPALQYPQPADGLEASQAIENAAFNQWFNDLWYGPFSGIAPAPCDPSALAVTLLPLDP